MPLQDGPIGVPFDPGHGTSRYACCASLYYNLKWPFNLQARVTAYKPSI
jgi:hypothetical protein